MILKCGCINCKNRKIGCHTTCAEYAAYKERLETAHENEKKEKYNPLFESRQLRRSKLSKCYRIVR